MRPYFGYYHIGRLFYYHMQQETFLIQYFKDKKVKDYFTFKKTRFTLQILYLIAKDFLKY